MYIDTDLEAGTTYYYWLRSFKIGELSDFEGTTAPIKRDVSKLSKSTSVTTSEYAVSLANIFVDCNNIIKVNNSDNHQIYIKNLPLTAEIKLLNVNGKLIRKIQEGSYSKPDEAILELRGNNGEILSFGVYIIQVTYKKESFKKIIILVE